jgi:hypothetical protein
MNILTILDAKNIHYKWVGSDEVAISCPNHLQHSGRVDNRESFNINVVKCVGFCFACGYSLSSAKLYSWLHGEDLDEVHLKAIGIRGILKRIEEMGRLKHDESTEEFFFPSGEPWSEDGFRGISLETYRKLGAIKVTRGRYQNRICFPIYVNDVLVGVDARALGDEQPKYLRNKNSTCKVNWLFPYDLVKDIKPKMLCIGEGIFHAINAVDKGFPALCYFGVNNFSMNKIMMMLATGAEEVCYFPDPDKAGYQAAQKICSALSTWFKVAYADISGYYLTGKDLGDLSKEEIEDAVANRGKPTLPLCLLENWELKIEFGAKCKRFKCPFNYRGECNNELYAPEQGVN